MVTLLAAACGPAAAGDTDTDTDTDAGGTEPAVSGTSTSTSSTSTTSSTTTPATTSSSTSTSTSTSTSSTTTATSSSGSEESSSSTTGEEVGSPGCGAAEQLAEGEHQFTIDGLDRRYFVRLPQNYDSEVAWPLIFALHGNGGDPGYWDDIGGDRDVRTAFADEAILIIPEAINNAWRDYNQPSETWPAGMVLELNFFDAVLETASNELCIDTDNVFSMGFSGGGSFSGVLGCQRDYIRAIAVGGSVIYFDDADCVSSPAAWITIGEQEFTDGRAEFRDFFVDAGGCDMTSTPDAPEGCEAYDSCDLDTPVTYCSHPGDHVWPDFGTDATRTFFQSFYAG